MTGSPEANVRLRVHVADIVARASFMRERQDTTYYTDVANISETTVQERLDRLLAAVARGNRDAFNRWLQWNELDIAGLRRVVQDVQLVDPETLPSWGETICAVVETKKSCVAPPTLALAPLDAPIATARAFTEGGRLSHGPRLVYIVRWLTCV